MSIIRVGLAETKKFAEGYASIFGSKKKKDQATEERTQAKQETPKKSGKAGKKKAKK